METQVFKFVLSQAYGNNPGLVNMLYIDNDPGTEDLLDINIQILKSQVDIIAKLQLNKSASDSNYHWELQFDNGVIDPEKIEKIKIVNNREWKIATKQHKNTQRDPEAGTSIYFLYIGEKEQSFTAGSNSVLTLDHMGAMSAGGTRVENVSLNWNPNRDYVEFEKNPSGSQEFGGQGSYRKSESNQIDIIHGSNPSRLPLSVGFSSSNIVLNDGSTDNTLTLRVVNTSETPIELRPESSKDSDDGSKFVISFEETLATIAQIGSINISDNTSAWQVAKSSLDWTITPQPATTQKPGTTQIKSGEGFEVTIKNIVTGQATGRSNLHFKYENFPGYGDGEFEVAIEKAPLLYSGSQGSGTLDVKGGINATQVTTIGQKNSNDTSAPSKTVLRVYHHGKGHEGGYGIADINGDAVLTTWNDGDTIGIGTNSAHDLELYADTVTKIKIAKNGNVGIVNGNLTIGTKESSATSAPSETALQIYPNSDWGIAHINGEAVLTTWNDGDSASIGTYSNHALAFYVKDDTKMTIDTDGQVGIGTTSPSVALDVNGALKVSDNAAVNSLNVSSNLTIGTKQASDAWGWSATALQIYTSSKWGIAHIKGEAVLATWNDGSSASIGTYSDHALAFYVHNETKMTIDTDGTVDVPGTVKTDGLQIGNTTIGENELKFLKELVDCDFHVTLYNKKCQEYAYMGLGPWGQWNYVRGVEEIDDGGHAKWKISPYKD